MPTEVIIKSIPCSDGMLDILRVDHMQSKRKHHCQICGANIQGVHFAYKFKYRNELLAHLVVRACCEEHQEALEEALASIDEILDCCPKGADDTIVWRCINRILNQQGFSIKLP